MDDAVRVRGREPVGDGEADLDGLPPRERAAERAVPQSLAQGLALEQLGDREGDAARGAHVVDVEDVRVREGRHGARFALEPRACDRVERESLGKDLDGDFAAEPRVARAVDLAHPAGADRRQDFVGSEASSLAECQR